MDDQKVSREYLEWVAEQMKNRNFSFEELLLIAKKLTRYTKTIENYFIELIFLILLFLERTAKDIAGFGKTVQSDIEEFLKSLDENRKKSASSNARKRAIALHSKPGGTYEKHAMLRNIWASGKYSSRDVCAEQECAEMSMSFSAARRALRNTPNPVSRSCV